MLEAGETENKEAAAYKRIGAYGSSSRECEEYGIPKIYFIGKFEKFDVIAMTKVDYTLDKIVKSNMQNADDVLCVFRDLVSYVFINSVGDY